MKYTFTSPHDPDDRPGKQYLSDGTKIPPKHNNHLLAEVRSIRTLRDFADDLERTNPGESFIYGVPKRFKSGEPFAISPASLCGQIDQQIARTRENFEFEHGPGILFLDIDHPNKRPEHILQNIYDAMPSLRGYDCVTQPSSSAFITDQDGKSVSKLAGLHVYFMVEDASRIPELGQILFNRLALAGFATYKISKSGSFLPRGLVDSAVWQPERLDYVGGAYLPAGWTQERRVVYNNGTSGAIVPSSAFKPLTKKEQGEVDAKYEALKTSSLNEQRIARANWERAGKTPSERASRKMFSEIGTLDGDFVITRKDGQKVTISEIFKNREEYEDQWCYDPIAGTDKHCCAKIIFQSDSVLNIWSFANGGTNYIAQIKNVWSDWVFITSQDMFLNLSNGDRLTAKAFDRSMSKHVPKKRSFNPPASTFLLNNLNGQQFYRIDEVYRPDKSERFFKEGKDHWINTYTFHEPEPSDADVSLVEKHIRNLFPVKSEADQLIMWLAHNVQYPGKKINWVPLLIGCEGDGKTTILNVMRAAMNLHNVGEVSNDSLASSFSSWAGQYALVAFEEIRIAGQNRTTIMNKLKAPIANKTVEVIRKGKDPINIPNVTNYMAMTNHDDALKLTESSNRWFILRTPFKDKEQVKKAGLDDKYFDELYDLIDNEAGAIRKWFLSIDVSAFRPTDRMPFKTDAFKLMFEQSKTDAEAAIEEIITQGAIGVSDKIISTWHLNHALKHNNQNTISTSLMAKTLKTLGYVRHPNAKIKWNNVVLTIYQPLDDIVYTTEQVRKLLDESTRDAVDAATSSSPNVESFAGYTEKRDKKKLFNTAG